MLLAKGLIKKICKKHLKNANPLPSVRKRLKTLMSVRSKNVKLNPYSFSISVMTLKVLPVRIKHKLLNRKCGQNVKHAVKQQRTTTMQVCKDSAE
jgi:hypothetical protein